VTINRKKLKNLGNLKLVAPKSSAASRPLGETEFEQGSLEAFDDSSILEVMPEAKVKATRKDLQLSRRFFHMCMGFGIATAYATIFSYTEAISLLGTGACMLYLFDQIRVSYPEIAKRFEAFSKYLLRAEEQLKESAMVPYIMAILLVILTFPKAIALSAIYTLAIADPLSAIVGINYGKHRVVANKSLEGSGAFFVVTYFIVITVFASSGIYHSSIWYAAFFVALGTTIFEMLPIRLDDNITIPLSMAFLLKIVCSVMEISVW